MTWFHSKSLRGGVIGFLLVLSAVRAEAVDRILVIGDSWASPLVAEPVAPCWGSDVFDEVLANNGFPEYTAYGRHTAHCGSTAKYWADPDRLALVRSELLAHPTIDIVHIVLGGNDFTGKIRTDGLPDELRARTAEERRADFWQPIIDDLRSLMITCLDVRADVKVVIAGYDVLDHFKAAQEPLNYAEFWQITRAEFHTWITEIGALKRDLAQELRQSAAYRNRTGYVQNFGLLQYLYGAPPEDVPFPGRAPCYDPFPGGDATLGIPWETTSDGIHLYRDYYLPIVQNAMDAYYTAWLRGDPPDTAPPEITIFGENPLVLDCGEEYIEPGGAATDAQDGDLTPCGVVEGWVDTTRPGEYWRTYRATDDAGNTAAATRTVYVPECINGVPLPDNPCPGSAGGFYEIGDPLCLYVPSTLFPQGPYRWRHNGDPLADTGVLKGASERLLEIGALEPADTGLYTCSYMGGTLEPLIYGPILVQVVQEVPAAGPAALVLVAAALTMGFLPRKTRTSGGARKPKACR